MNATTVILTVALVAAFTTLGSAKVAAVPLMREKAAHVGFSVDAYRRIGALEILAAMGLLVGIVVHPLGALAAAGLVLLAAGAALAHRRAGDQVKAATPAIVLGLLAVAYLVVALVTG